MQVELFGRDENGMQEIKSCDNSIMTMDYQSAIGHGIILDHTPWSKLGYNADVDSAAEDLWSPGGVYVFPTAAMQMEVVSSHAEDKAGGTGARVVRLYYLDSTFTEKYEDIVPNGVNAVATVATDIYRVNRFFVHAAGSGGAAAGNISIRHLSDSPIYSQIVAGQQRSKKIIYTVPKGKKLFIASVQVSCGAANANRQVRFTTKATYCKEDAARTDFFMDFSDILIQDSSFYMNLTIPTVFPEGVDIKVSAISPDGATRCACVLRGWLETVAS